MKKKKMLMILAATVTVIASATGLYFYYLSMQTQFALNFINKNMDVGGIRLGMSENEVKQLWGEGEKLDGVFGGYGKVYQELQVQILFPNDKDNDLYGKVAQLMISNPDFAVFQVKVGDDKNEAAAKLISKGLEPAESGSDIYKIGEEFLIALRGTNQVESIQIWFSDKDLKDRHY
jgi:hypothetical protein